MRCGSGTCSTGPVSWTQTPCHDYCICRCAGQRCGRAAQPIEAPVRAARAGGRCRQGEEGAIEHGGRVVLPLVIDVLRRDWPCHGGSAIAGAPGVGRRVPRPNKRSRRPVLLPLRLQRRRPHRRRRHPARAARGAASLRAGHASQLCVGRPPRGFPWRGDGVAIREGALRRAASVHDEDKVLALLDKLSGPQAGKKEWWLVNVVH
jgi:hypothetical protein